MIKYMFLPLTFLIPVASRPTGCCRKRHTAHGSEPPSNLAEDRLEQTLGPGLHESDISLCDEMGEGLLPLEFYSSPG